MMRNWLWFIPSIFVFLGILLLSTAFSAPIQIEGVGFLDKIEHAFAYFVLIVSLLIGFSRTKNLTQTVWWLLVLSAITYGAALEWVQYRFFPDRYFEWKDAFANAIGVTFGALLFRLFKHG